MAKRFGASEAAGYMDFTLEGNHRSMPFTVGIEGPDDTVIPLIKVGEHLPKSCSQVFTTDGSFQMSAYLHLVMGERKFASCNEDLCVVRFDEGSFRMAGKAKYKLSVEVTGAGVIKVSAVNLDKPKGSTCRISYDNAVITGKMVAKIQETAAAHAERDGQVMERFEYMAAVRSRINTMADEYWPLAKRKMSWGEKSSFKKCRKRIYELIEPGPDKITDEQIDELRHIDQAELPNWEVTLKDRAEQAEKWYRK